MFERSETSLDTAFALLSQKKPKILRFAQNDNVAYFFVRAIRAIPG